MKKIVTLLALFLSFAAFAQAPEGINYQAIARDLTGSELANTPVTIQVQIMNSSLTSIYQEDHSTTTNAFGLFNIVIGQGQNPTSNFSNINWAASPYYLRIYVDANGSGLVDMGYTQLWSVPYALYAKESANGPQGLPGINCWDTDGDGVNDPSEDINGDNLWNAIDCKGDTGAAGAQGATGPPGAVGATGPTGATGIGIDSVVANASGTISVYYNNATVATTVPLYGPTGAVGATGPTGAAGANGSNGATGPTGAAGANGSNGATGATGPTGAAGANGSNGATGATGPTGAAGASGSNGATGPTGAAGANGSNGATGATGPTGAAGANGSNGATGATGPTGAAGANGSNGATGATGPTGVAGANGSNGATGATGPTGAAGANGSNGATGATGPTGATGVFAVVGTTGQTLYYNGAAWTPTSNLYNNGTNVLVGVGTPAVSAGATRYFTLASTNAYTTDLAAIELIGSGASTTDIVGRIDFTQVTTGPTYQVNSRIAGNRGGEMLFFSNNGTSLVERMRINGNGNVGIGTTNPQTLLQVSDLAGSPSVSLLSSATGSATLFMGTSANAYMGAMRYDNSTNTMMWWTNNTIQMSLNANGYLGIGNGFSTPQNYLHINGSTTTLAQFTNSTTGATGSDGLFIGLNSVGSGFINYNEANSFSIMSNSIAAIVLDNAGRVGVGGIPQSPYTFLAYGANESIGVDNAGVKIGDVMGNSFANYFYVDFESSPRFLFMGANIGVGTSTPAEQLDIASGNVRINGANDYKYSTAKTHYYSIPAAAFSMENTSVCDKAMTSGNVYTVGGTAATVAYLTAPVYLPDGATVTGVTFYVVDNDGTYNLQNGQLWRNDASTSTSYGNSSLMATIAPPASTNSTLVQTSTTNAITNPVIDNLNYTYWLRWGTQQANANLRLVKVLITYTVTKAD